VSHPFCLLPELKSPPVVFFLAPPPLFLRRRSASPSAASSRAPTQDPDLHQHHLTLLKLTAPAFFQFLHRNVLSTCTPSFLRCHSSASSSFCFSSASPPRSSTRSAPHHPHEALQALLDYFPALRPPEHRHRASKLRRRLCHCRSAATAPPPPNSGHPRDRRKPLSNSPAFSLTAGELSCRNCSPSICPREESRPGTGLLCFKNFQGSVCKESVTFSISFSASFENSYEMVEKSKNGKTSFVVFIKMSSTTFVTKV
jgi:hypothetical protein